MARDVRLPAVAARFTAYSQRSRPPIPGRSASLPLVARREPVSCLESLVIPLDAGAPSAYVFDRP